MSDAGGRDADPLVQRVDALLKRNQETAGGPADDVPVLTEIVSPQANAADALAAELERAVLARLEKELDGTLAALRTVLRDAVAAAVARELEARGYATRRPAPPEG